MTIFDELGIEITDEERRDIVAENESFTPLFFSTTKIKSGWVEQKVYVGTDTSFKKQFRINNIALTSSQMALINGIELCFKGVLYSSEDSPTAFDWDTNRPSGEIIFTLGRIEDLPYGLDKCSEVILNFGDVSRIVWGALNINVVKL